MAISMEFPPSPYPAANVSTIPQRSLLRYPGGKTWLVPHIRAWLSKTKPDILLDPFAGGGITPLTAVMEGLVKRCVMVELDRDVAAFWLDALRKADFMIQKISGFRPTRENVAEIERQSTNGFRTLVLNRTRNSGILAQGASFVKSGENGKGIASRWYPDTLVRRLRAIARYSDKISFIEGDGMQVLEHSDYRASKVAAFIDPPYTAGGKRAGARLYTRNKVDHSRLFDILARSDMDFLMTYDCSPEIVELVQKHKFFAVSVRMKNAHHNKVDELVITRGMLFR